MADQFLKLTKREDLQKLIDDALEEGLQLDYKDSRALGRSSDQVSELCKDVSAFANSAGGQIIYGIAENRTTHKPDRIDEGVIDPKVTREWIEQVLNSRVQPRMQGVRIDRIELSPNHFAFVITIPPTSTGPHQSDDKLYYRRFELQSVAMHDYEVRDVMRRTIAPSPFAQIELQTTTIEYENGQTKPIVMTGLISNASAEPIYYSVFSMYLDPRFIVRDYGGLESQGLQDMGENVTLARYTRRTSIPNSFPLFKEVHFNLFVPRFSFVFDEIKSPEPQVFPIVYDIRVPGYVGGRGGLFALLGNQLSLSWIPDSALNALP